MFQYHILAPELQNDPLGRGYSGMSNAAIAADLNMADIAVNVDTVEGQDIFEAVDPTDYAGLSADEKSLLYAIMGMGTIRVNGTNTKAALLEIFDAGTDTRDNLAALQTQDVTRASQLGLGLVREGHVADTKNRYGI